MGKHAWIVSQGCPRFHSGGKSVEYAGLAGAVPLHSRPMSEITSIVFDVGNVLVDVRYGGLLDFFHAHGLRYDDRAHLVDLLRLEPYERGEISDEEFLTHVGGLFVDPADPAELRRQWLDVFAAVPEMMGLAAALQARCEVYLLSNTSPLHWRHVCREFGLERLGHGLLTSYDAGCRKPDAEIYRAAESAFGLTPAATVFIDDIEENAAAARARGWHAITHTGVGSTRRALREFGVQAP